MTVSLRTIHITGQVADNLGSFMLMELAFWSQVTIMPHDGEFHGGKTFAPGSTIAGFDRERCRDHTLDTTYPEAARLLIGHLMCGWEEHPSFLWEAPKPLTAKNTISPVNRRLDL